jgi:hypothetical protein
MNTVTGECVEWPGLRMKTGYGRRYFAGSGYGRKDGCEVYAHRAAWEEVHGPIPAGMNIHHRCENKACVNVDHLEMLDTRDHKGKGGHGKLTREDAELIRAFRGAGHKGGAVAAAFGCSEQQVCNIVKGRCWA